jgi:hypothetical protein
MGLRMKISRLYSFLGCLQFFNYHSKLGKRMCWVILREEIVEGAYKKFVVIVLEDDGEVKEKGV